jgi:hypothetical protein
MSAPESVVQAVMGLIPPEQHGQLCPVWTGRNRQTGAPGPLNECDCWQAWHAQRRANAAFAASLEWAAEQVEHPNPCPASVQCEPCATGHLLRRWARGERP